MLHLLRNRRRALQSLLHAAAAFWGVAAKKATAQSPSPRSPDTIYTRFGERIEVGEVAPGEWLTAIVEDDWPIFVRHRTAAQVAALRAESTRELPEPERDEVRAPDAMWLAVSGICTHAGCKLVAGLGPHDGWACYCHGSFYDISGRVRGGPAKHNLAVIRHQWVDRTGLVLRAPDGAA